MLYICPSVCICFFQIFDLDLDLVLDLVLDLDLVSEYPCTLPEC